MKPSIFLLAFMFYPMAKQFSGELSSAVVSVCTPVVVSMEIPLAAQNAHTHTCMDVMLLGNIVKTMGKCNWFSADSKVRGCWTCTKVDLPQSALLLPALITSAPSELVHCDCTAEPSEKG